MAAADHLTLVEAASLVGDTARATMVVVDDVHTHEALSTAELLLDPRQARRSDLAALLRGPGHRAHLHRALYTRLHAKGIVLTPGTDLRAVEGSTVIVANVCSGAGEASQGCRHGRARGRESFDGYALPRAQRPGPRALRGGRLRRSARRPSGHPRRHPRGEGDLTPSGGALARLGRGATVSRLREPDVPVPPFDRRAPVHPRACRSPFISGP